MPGPTDEENSRVAGSRVRSARSVSAGVASVASMHDAPAPLVDHVGVDDVDADEALGVGPFHPDVGLVAQADALAFLAVLRGVPGP